MKHLYFVRHGESVMNTIGVVSGRTDTPLTARGHYQAQKAGQNIKEQKIVLDRIFSSPLQRAHHTAIGIVKHLDFEEDSIELSELIRERNFGEIEGKSLTNDFNVSLDVYFENEAVLDHIDGIETLKSLHERAKEAISFLKQQPEDTILLVAHSAFGRALYRVVHNLPYNATVPYIKNAEIIKLI